MTPTELDPAIRLGAYALVVLAVLLVIYVVLKKLENRALRDDDPTNDEDLQKPISVIDALIDRFLRIFKRK